MSSKGYTTREVAEVLGLSASTILSWARSGLLTPERSARGAYVFSFQDLVLLRSARELLEAEMSARRVRRALAALREQLPAGRPLSAVRISALGDRILVRDGERVWEPDSCQLRLDLGAPEAVERASEAVERAAADAAEPGDGPGMSADD
ncbi:MAG TPA: helix-turn-helix domain-containing protein, partial [Longimicrobiales bacterium]|nr:helix-turn-helix domain-containing protein [Longimicrobiales bacterium]